MREVIVEPTLPDVGVKIAQGLLNARRRPSPDKGLPDKAVVITDLTQDAERAAAYSRVCGYGVRSFVPSTWLHVLTFPLQAQIMSGADFPFPPAGIVHVSNEITMHRPVGVTETLRLSVEAKNLQPHKKGATFDFRGTIHVGDQLVWEGVSNYLAPKAKVAGEPVAAEREQMPDGVPSQRWRVPADQGRRYAKVSGDVNPIHLHPLTARVFGFKRPIIHGMWTHARALAAFGGTLPEAYQVRVQFTKPISLPSTVGFIADHADGFRRFAVVGKDDKPRLVGSLRALG